MISQILMMVTLVSIWLSLCFSLVVIAGATHFWLKNSTKIADTSPLPHYPKITIVVPAHNEAVVIKPTIQAILNLAYPADQLEILLFADNCSDNTAAIIQQTINQPQYATRNVRLIERTGSGSKAGVLNDALKMATGEYICVYDADAIPERYALHFLVQKAIKNPKYAAVYGRNKTRNAAQNFLTRCINQEIIVTQRIQHVAIWHLFRIGRIPGTNFIIKTAIAKQLGGWQQGALTEDTALSFELMARNHLIALAENSEAFQQEPESLRDYYWQRLRWAKGNYQVILANLHHLFDKSSWRVKLETFYYAATFLWFNLAIVLSDFFFASNVLAWICQWFNPAITLPYTLANSNITIAEVLLYNWVLMILLYVLQITLACCTQYGQATANQIWLAIAAYFTYSQLFIVVSLHAVYSVFADKITHKSSTHWVKTKRFD